MPDNDPIGDFLKEYVGISEHQLEALQSVAKVIGTITAIWGYVMLAKSVLTALGVFSEDDKVKAEVDVLWHEFQAVLVGLDQAQTMRDVANQIQAARTELQNLQEFAPDDPSAEGSINWEGLRGLVLNNTKNSLNTLGDPRYWVRPFFPDLVYRDPWEWWLLPPGAGPSLVFDYRLTLPSYMEALAIRLAVLGAMERDRNVATIEIQAIVAALEGYFNTIRAGIHEHRVPSLREARWAQHPNEVTTWTLWGVQLFGAVERYSTLRVVDHWPADEYPSRLGYPDPITEADQIAYQKFVVRHLVRTMGRWKQVYNMVGLGVVEEVLTNLKTMAGITPVSVEGPTGDWSMRELGRRSFSLVGLEVQEISLRQMLGVLQTFNAEPYTSVRPALAQ